MFMIHAVFLTLMAVLVPLAPASAAQVPAPAPVPALVPPPVEDQSAVAVVPAEHRLVLEQPAFGHSGQLVVAGISSGTVQGIHDQRQGQSAERFSFSIGGRAGGFIGSHVLLMGQLSSDFAYIKDVYGVRVGAGPVVAIHAPMAPHWGFLPSLGAIYQFSREHQSGTANADNHEIYVRLHLDAVVHLAQHFSVTFGPYVHQSIYDHTKGTANLWETTYGVSAGLLAWR